MPILLALFAAVANAFATVLQRVGIEEGGESRAPSAAALMSSVLRRPIWFLGLALTTASFLLQAIAISLGNLSTVQPVMVTEIVFLVAILGLWFHQRVGWREYVGAAGTAAGLGTFLALSSATGGHERPTRTDWILLLIACAGAVMVALTAAQRGSRSWRAVCYALGAAICFALTAACIKATADEWSSGALRILFHFEVYGVAASGLAGLIISQRALEAGPVAASQSTMLIVNPISSIVMGIWLFGDRLHTSGPRLALEVLALSVMVLALFVLSMSPLVAASATVERLSHAELGPRREIGPHPENCPT